IGHRVCPRSAARKRRFQSGAHAPHSQTQKEVPLVMSRVLVTCVLLLVCPLLAAAAEFDDCDARFVAAIGSNAYQFSPLLKGDLGTVRLYSILSYQKIAALKRTGRAFWELDVVGPENDARLVFHAEGVARIGARGA